VRSSISHARPRGHRLVENQAESSVGLVGSRYRESLTGWLPNLEKGTNTGQTACKPGSVLALRRWMAIPLGRPSPNASRDRPGRRRGNTAAGCPACRPYLVLLPVGFAVPLPLPVARWALTPPFHPCLLVCHSKAGQRGGLFSVALSLGSPPPAVSRHRVSVEPGLSSPSRLPGKAQPSSRLTCSA